jgi:hypothetical protein
MSYSFNGSEYVARANRLRKLMVGPPDSDKATAGIQEIVNERIAELTKRLDEQSKETGGSGGPEPEPR